MARCRATTRKGERCKRKALAGSAYCHLHRPARRTPNAERLGAERPADWLRDQVMVSTLGGAALGALAGPVGAVIGGALGAYIGKNYLKKNEG